MEGGARAVGEVSLPGLPILTSLGGLCSILHKGSDTFSDLTAPSVAVAEQPLGSISWSPKGFMPRAHVACCFTSSMGSGLRAGRRPRSMACWQLVFKGCGPGGQALLPFLGLLQGWVHTWEPSGVGQIEWSLRDPGDPDTRLCFHTPGSPCCVLGTSHPESLGVTPFWAEVYPVPHAHCLRPGPRTFKSRLIPCT